MCAGRQSTHESLTPQTPQQRAHKATPNAPQTNKPLPNQLHEEDAFYGAWRKRCEEPRTRLALAYAQHGQWGPAQAVLGDLNGAAAAGAALVGAELLALPCSRVSACVCLLACLSCQLAFGCSFYPPCAGCPRNGQTASRPPVPGSPQPNSCPQKRPSNTGPPAPPNRAPPPPAVARRGRPVG